MATHFPYYEVKLGDDLGDPEFWNARFRDVDQRLFGQEEIEKDWKSAVEELTENGVARIDAAITPLVAQLAQDAQLGALFVSESNTTIDVGIGGKVVAITSANAKRFAAAAWVAITTTEAPYSLMIGPVISYNRETGSLAVDVQRVHGPLGLRTGFVVSATSYMDYRADRVFREAAGGLSGTTVEAALLEIVQNFVTQTRNIGTGTGLIGGGPLTNDLALGLDVAYTDARYLKLLDFASATFAWSRITGRPTDLAGYGIADAYTKTQVDGFLNGKQPTIGFTPENAAKRGAANGYAPLGADGRVPSANLPVDGSYQGTYNAATNSPAISNGSGAPGNFYIVSNAGTVAADGVGPVDAGDQVRRGPTAWQRVPSFSPVKSVNGEQGVVIISASDLPDGGAAGVTLFGKATLADIKTFLALVVADISDFASGWTARLEAVTTAFTRTLLGSADATAARASLGLGTAATQATTAFVAAAHAGAGGTAHAEATTTLAGFISAADKVKLNGLANYVHPTGDGNQHVPANGTGNANKVLTASSTAGAYTWSFVDFQYVAGKPTTLSGYGISDAYTKATIDGALDGKQDALGFTPENSANKGSANGYASLDSGGKVPLGQLSADSLNPPGTVVHFAGSAAPSGWLKCNGASVSRTTYAALFAAIGTTYGSLNANVFNLPDLRGEFIRGLDDGRGVDASRTLGSAQADLIRAHNHTASMTAAGGVTPTGTIASGGAHTHTGTTNSDSHSHTGTTDAVSNHPHPVGVRYGVASSSANQDTGRAAAGLSGSGIGTEINTSQAGGHSHAFTTSTDAHSHTFTTASAGAHSHTIAIDSIDPHTHAITINNSAGAETRPRNVALLAIIKT